GKVASTVPTTGGPSGSPERWRHASIPPVTDPATPTRPYQWRVSLRRMPLGLSARRPRGPRRPPGPRGQPFVGDLDAYQADRLGWLRRAHCEYGDLVRITPSMTVVNHPEVAHEILADTNDRFLLDTATLAGRRHRAAQTRRLAD